MIKFIDRRADEIKQAFSLRHEGEFTFIRYYEFGKEYKYLTKNIKLTDGGKLPFTLYAPTIKCYYCGKRTEVLTYIVYADNKLEDVTYPWDEERLLRMQNVPAHIDMPEIEFYGLKVLGHIEAYDRILLKLFPDRIKELPTEYRGSYAMNLCRNCGAQQGRFFLYKHINGEIKKKNQIKTLEI